MAKVNVLHECPAVCCSYAPHRRRFFYCRIGKTRKHVMRIVSGSQLTLELQPDLLRRYTTLRQCVHHTALNYPQGMKNLAADCDLSESELSRRLNPSDGDNRSCDVNLMVRIVEITGDVTPLNWLIAKFLRDPEATKSVAVQQLAQLMPYLVTLLADAGITAPPSKGGRR